MKRICTLLFVVLSIMNLTAQSAAKNDYHLFPQNGIVKIDGLQSTWNKPDNETNSNSTSNIFGDENVTFSPTTNGIYVNIINGTNKIKLLGLTGQLLLDGDLTKGHFFIPTRQGMYFLKINNKSYKVICK